MDVVKEFLIMAAGLVIAVALIIVGFKVFNGAMLIGNKVAVEEQRTLKNMEENDIFRYDGMEITGTKVINYVEKMYQEYGINVAIESAINQFNMSDVRRLSDLRNATGEYYLSPVKRYVVTVDRDDNECVDRISVCVVN